MDLKKISVDFNVVSGLFRKVSKNNVGVVNVQQFLFMKKIKSDIELQILKVSLFLNSLPKNYNLITDIKEKENKEINLENIYKTIKNHTEHKDKKEILKLKDFFVSIGLHKLFAFPNDNEQIIEKLLM